MVERTTYGRCKKEAIPYYYSYALSVQCLGMGEKYKEKIVTLIKNNPQISIYKIGFPMDWFDEDIWK